MIGRVIAMGFPAILDWLGTAVASGVAATIGFFAKAFIDHRKQLPRIKLNLSVD
jgi:hypothetical protein